MAVLCDSCDLVLEVDELRRFIQHSGYEKTEEYHKCHIKTFIFPSVSFILPLLVWSVIRLQNKGGNFMRGSATGVDARKRKKRKIDNTTQLKHFVIFVAIFKALVSSERQSQSVILKVV